MSEYKQVLSYSEILNDIKSFKKSSLYDQPGTWYFKVMFYFENSDTQENHYTSNLLGLYNDMNTRIPSSDNKEGESITDKFNSSFKQQRYSDGADAGYQDGIDPEYISYNTAYNYLMINGEVERANYLKKFIYLLSNISTYSPWYFKSVEGLDTAVDRTYLKEFKIEEERKAFTIKCAQDSVDNRITTLLELYRAACFSHEWKREIVPANLRKFDMGIFIFQPATDGYNYSNIKAKLSGKVDSKDNSRSNTISGSLYTNCHYLEFHNCEIDHNASLKTCYASFDNEKGSAVEPVITISYDDCYESSYNETLALNIGDFVAADLMSQYDADETNNDLNSIQDDYDTKKGYIQNAVETLAGKAVTAVKSVVKKAILGNVYGLSVSNIMMGVNQLTSGDITTGLNTLGQQTKNTVKSIKNGTVVHDLIPSVMNGTKNAIRRLGNVSNSIVRNL